MLNEDTYQIMLPSGLPPSHRGKACRIVYKLLIGIGKENTKTKVVSIPFRLFNRTEVDGTREIYEVLQPCVTTRDEAITIQISGDTPLPSPLFRTQI